MAMARDTNTVTNIIIALRSPEPEPQVPTQIPELADLRQKLTKLADSP